MIDVGFLQNIYNKISGQEYNKDLDNLHEIAEMLRKLLEKDCFEGIILNNHPKFRYNKIYKPSTRKADYYHSESSGYQINYNNRTVTLSNAASNTYALVYLPDDLNYINFKDAFISSVLDTLSNTHCPDISVSCPSVNSNVHVKAEIIPGFVSPEELIYIDKIRYTSSEILKYNTSDNGGDYIFDLTTDTAVFEMPSGVLTGGEELIISYSSNAIANRILKCKVESISGNKVTLKFEKALNELMLKNSSSGLTTSDPENWMWGIITDYSSNPKAFVIKTTDGDKAYHKVRFFIYPNDTTLTTDIQNLSNSSWTLNVINYGVVLGYDASTTEDSHDLELIDVDIPDGDVKDKYKLRHDQISPIYNGYSRNVVNISDYGNNNRDVIIEKTLYMGPSGHQFDNWGSLENNRQVTNAFGTIIKEYKNTNNFIYNKIADNKLYNILSLFRSVPIDLDKYNLKQRLWIDITDLNISSNTWQDLKAYIYEFKPKTKTILVHSRIQDLTVEDINDYNTGNDLELILIDDNGNNKETSLPSWAESIDKEITIDSANNIVYTTWKIVIKDSELIINSTDLTKTYNLYITNRENLTSYTPGNIINIKGKINIKLVPGLMFKLDNVLSEYTNNFNSAQTVNGIKYPGFAANASMINEDLIYETAYINAMSDGTQIIQNGDTFVDPLPQYYLRDKTYVASPYSISQFQISVMVKGVDTTNTNIIDELKRRIKFAITTHTYNNNMQLEEIATNVSEPTITTWHNPQTMQDEDVVIFTASWSGSQMNNIASNFNAGTKIVVSILDSNNRITLAEASTNLYIPASIDLSATGTTNGESCGDIEHIIAKLYNYKPQIGSTFTGLVQTNIKDMRSCSINKGIGDTGMAYLSQTGISLKSENILFIQPNTARIKFIGNYMHRALPVANGICEYRGPLSLLNKYDLYIERNNNEIIFEIMQVSNNTFRNRSRLSTNSIEPSVVDFILIPGEIDNTYVKQELEALTGIKHLYYITGTTSTARVLPSEDNTQNGFHYIAIIPTCDCTGGQTTKAYDVYLPTQYQNGSTITFVLNNKTYVGIINGQFIYVRINCPQVYNCPDTNEPPMETI